MNKVTLRPGHTGEIIPLQLLLLSEASEVEVERYVQSAIRFVAELDGLIIGACLMDRVSEETLELKNLAVDPNYQGSGIGRGLLEFAIDMAIDAGCHEIIASTDNTNSSGFIFLQKLGFQLDSIEKGYYSKENKALVGHNNLPCEHKIWFLKTLLSHNS
jgi:ribosomal protein S18 acetylase RimI-like enzyme